MSLPNETLAAIFDSLPPHVLAVISCVSYRFNAVAERLLYASISISDSLSSQSPLPRRSLRCFRSIRARPHLVETIKRLQIRWQGANNSTYLDLANACVEVSQTLQTLIYLEGLDVFLGPANRTVIGSNSGGIHAIEQLLHNCHFPHLRYCSLGAEWAKSPPTHPYTHLLPIFLATSVPILRHLRLSDAHSPLNPPLPPTALPLLTYFRGSPDTAASILPGRPVTALALIGQDSDVNRENLPRFALTSMPLVMLDLSAMQARPVLLRSIAEYLPQLEHLRVRLALRHTLHYALSGITLLAGLAPVLRDLRHLVVFDLSPTEINAVQQANYAEEAALCAQWFRECPSLRRILFPSGHEWQYDSQGNWVAV
ncbi:F-box domain-containing protein [Mycena indigotica]|uniref:F-box domain-containing protein n=1 Tax=Mycena indigotica TaxID=2126181 RepID=A0A8H6T0P9_9AGAR|nr:F-box domain-containing protein [Mycena indigotica]KAF7309815.1 F-box domain-containing protein [Mycena indigotica]